APAPAPVVAAPSPAAAAAAAAAAGRGAYPGAFFTNSAGVRRWVSHSSFPKGSSETLYTRVNLGYTSGESGGTDFAYVPFTYTEATGLRTGEAYYRSNASLVISGNPLNRGDVLPDYQSLWWVGDDFSLHDPYADAQFGVASLIAASIVTGGVAAWAAAGAGAAGTAAATGAAGASAGAGGAVAADTIAVGNGAFLGEGIASGVGAWDAAAINAGLTLTTPAAALAVAE